MSTNNHEEGSQMRTILERRRSRSTGRSFVLGEFYDPAQDDATEEVVFPKSFEERKRIQECLKDLFCFRPLDDQVKEKVIDAMERRDVQQGEEIFRKGDEGNVFYVIDCGCFEAFVDGEEGPLTTYKDTGYFGELALVHRHSRSETVRAVTKGSIWAIPRTTFSHLVIKHAFERHQNYMSMFTKVPKLRSLTEYERYKLVDHLKPVRLEEGRTLFKEGDEGDGMFFVESGRLSVTQMSPTAGKSEVVNEIGPGEYVGELALAENQQRVVTVTAMEDSVLGFLSRQALE